MHYDLKKRPDNVKVVIAGAGSAGYSIFKILQKSGFKDLIVLDKRGAIHRERQDILYISQVSYFRPTSYSSKIPSHRT